MRAGVSKKGRRAVMGSNRCLISTIDAKWFKARNSCASFYRSLFQAVRFTSSVQLRTHLHAVEDPMDKHPFDPRLVLRATLGALRRAKPVQKMPSHILRYPCAVTRTPTFLTVSRQPRRARRTGEHSESTEDLARAMAIKTEHTNHTDPEIWKKESILGESFLRGSLWES